MTLVSGDFFFLYVLQLASERVWRENKSARRLGSNVFTDWHVWGCGTVFFVTLPGVDRLSFVEIACCAMKKNPDFEDSSKRSFHCACFRSREWRVTLTLELEAESKTCGLNFSYTSPSNIFFGRDDRMTLAEGLVDDFSILVFFFNLQPWVSRSSPHVFPR